MISIAYIVVALVVFRSAAGHFAYSYTQTPVGRKRWQNGPCFPLEHQDGSEEPAWGGGIWRGFLVAIAWPVAVPAVLFCSRLVPRLQYPLTVGNERRARRAKRSELEPHKHLRGRLGTK